MPKVLKMKYWSCAVLWKMLVKLKPFRLKEVFYNRQPTGQEKESTVSLTSKEKAVSFTSPQILGPF